MIFFNIVVWGWILFGILMGSIMWFCRDNDKLVINGVDEEMGKNSLVFVFIVLLNF